MRGIKAYSKAKILHKKMYGYSSIDSLSKKTIIYKQYFELIRKAAYWGNVEAQYELGQQYEDINFLGIPNPNYNPKKCIYWYTKACSQMHSEACNNLGHFYEKGEGCKKNLKMAFALYKKSSDLGSNIGKKNYKLMIKQLSASGMYGNKKLSKLSVAVNK